MAVDNRLDKGLLLTCFFNVLLNAGFQIRVVFQAPGHFFQHGFSLFLHRMRISYPAQIVFFVSRCHDYSSLIKHVIENLPARLRHNISGSKITVGLLSVSFKRCRTSHG